MPYEETTMNGVSSDYIALKLAEARRRDLMREHEKDQLAKLAVRRIKNVIMRKPKVHISKN
jgi:hypothetical protein